MRKDKNIEIYNLTLELLQNVEIEYNVCKYDFDDLPRKIFLKNILDKLHEIRVITQNQTNKEQKNVKKS